MTKRSTARRLLAGAALLAFAAPAAGQGPEVAFGAGRVTITARDAPLASILAAWEQRGGAQFVDAGRLSDITISIQLVGVAEREALRVLLRSAAGYVAIPKSDPEPGTSAFDQIFIMAGSARPRAARRRPATPAPELASGANGQQPQDQAQTPASAPAAALAAADLDELDEIGELELVESLRRRFQSAAPAAQESEPTAFRSRPDAGTLRAAPRPGMVIEADEPQNRPNPVRRRDP